MESSSLKEVLNKLGLTGRGHSYDYLKTRLADEFIDYKSLFLKYKPKTKYDLKDIFCSPSKYQGPLKARVLELGFIPYICSECSQTDTYNGKTLSLQLDHIDGNSNNNLKENLRFLCPNCHSQTTTYSGKQKRTTERKCSSNDCRTFINKNNKSGFCIECLIKTGYRKRHSSSKRKFEVSKEKLSEMIKTKSYREISKIFNVSDVSIRNRCIKFGLV